MILTALLFPCAVHPLPNTPMVNSRLVHSCIAFGQRRSHYESMQSCSIPTLGSLRIRYTSPTITKHWDLIARLHAKCGIYIELHAWSFAVSGVRKMSCCLLSPCKYFHVIDQWQLILPQSWSLLRGLIVQRTTQLLPTVRACVHHQTTSRETFTSSRDRRGGGMLQQSGLKPLWMTHTKRIINVVYCSHI